MTSALVTDFYELTMMQGYFLEHHNPRVVFDMFYRTNPFNGGYTIFTGLEELVTKLEEFRFSKEDIEYLRSLGKFQESFLDYLSSYRFTGDLYAYAGRSAYRVHSPKYNQLPDINRNKSFPHETCNKRQRFHYGVWTEKGTRYGRRSFRFPCLLCWGS